MRSHRTRVQPALAVVGRMISGKPSYFDDSMEDFLADGDEDFGATDGQEFDESKIDTPFSDGLDDDWKEDD